MEDERIKLAFKGVTKIDQDKIFWQGRDVAKNINRRKKRIVDKKI